MQCILCKIYFWKVFHKYYNLICIFICTPICTKKIILEKSGCYRQPPSSLELQPSGPAPTLSEPTPPGCGHAPLLLARMIDTLITGVGCVPVLPHGGFHEWSCTDLKRTAVGGGFEDDAISSEFYI
jgi:hypothetical protein